MQQQRQDRMLDAARDLASAGGFDGMQMRDVAERADVALGTLYRYFPSKVHLLVALMRHETQGLAERLRRRPPAGDTAAERVTATLAQGMKALDRDRRLAEAMMRALMSADGEAAPDVHAVTAQMTGTITDAMHGPDRAPTHEDDAVARVLEQVWLSAMLTWLSGRATIDEVIADLEVAARLLLR